MSWSFEIPTGRRFTCSECGDCCRSVNVPLAPGEAERLAALDWTGRVERLVGATPSVPVPRGGGRRRLPHREDGACTFLGDDQRCLIHAHFGADAKPLACRQYPFSFERSKGESVVVDVSLACRSVSRDEGEPLPSHASEWSRLLDEAGGPREERHRLDARQRLPPDVLSELEGHLIELLGRGGGAGDGAGPAEDAGATRTDALHRARCCMELARLATTGDPTTEAARALRTAIASAVGRQVAARPPEGTMDRSQRAIFFQWTFLAVNPLPPDVDLMTSDRLATERRRRLRAARRHGEPKERPMLGGREIAPTNEQVAAVDAAALLADEDQQLARFFETRIVGRRYLRAGEAVEPFVTAVPKLFAWLPILLWTAKAVAADRGAARAESCDLRAAIRLVDPSVGFLSTSALPKKVARACDFVFVETDFATCATLDVVSGRV